VGGESGAGAQPSHPDYFRAVRDACQAAGVPFFFKQWGEWVPESQLSQPALHLVDQTSHRVGKKAAGALLDGRESREMPERDR